MPDTDKKETVDIETAKVNVRKIVHDLNNLLSTINGASRMLAKEISSAQGQESLARIQSSVKRGGDLSQKLNDAFHKPDKPKKKLEGNQLSFKVAGMTALVVGESASAEILHERGFKALEARNLDEALLVQDDYLGDVDVLIHDQIEADGMELFQSMREETVFIDIRTLDRNFEHAVFEVAQSIVQNNAGL